MRKTIILIILGVLIIPFFILSDTTPTTITENCTYENITTISYVISNYTYNITNSEDTFPDGCVDCKGKCLSYKSINETCVTTKYITTEYSDLIKSPVENIKTECIRKHDITVDAKKVDFDKLGVVGSTKDNILTIKSLKRGGSNNDFNPDSCWNPGVPCTQIDIVTNKIITQIKDKDEDYIDVSIQ